MFVCFLESQWMYDIWILPIFYTKVLDNLIKLILQKYSLADPFVYSGSLYVLNITLASHWFSFYYSSDYAGP